MIKIFYTKKLHKTLINLKKNILDSPQNGNGLAIHNIEKALVFFEKLEKDFTKFQEDFIDLERRFEQIENQNVNFTNSEINFLIRNKKFDIQQIQKCVIFLKTNDSVSLDAKLANFEIWLTEDLEKLKNLLKKKKGDI